MGHMWCRRDGVVVVVVVVVGSGCGPRQKGGDPRSEKTGRRGRACKVFCSGDNCGRADNLIFFFLWHAFRTALVTHHTHATRGRYVWITCTVYWCSRRRRRSKGPTRTHRPTGFSCCWHPTAMSRRRRRGPRPSATEQSRL